MTLESSIKDVISKKLEDGTIEKLIEDQLEKGVTNALNSLFGSYGDVTKVIEKQVKSVMIPYLEKYDYSDYIVKLDSVLVDVLKKSTADNTKILENFKELILPEDREELKASELFEIWCKYVAEEVEIEGLKVQYDDGVSYEWVEVTMEVDFEEPREWSSFEYATLVFECEHDEKMNFAIRLHKWKKDKKEGWSMSYDSPKDIDSLRRLSGFGILLMRLDRAGTKLIMDTDSERDDIKPEKEPEATYG